MANKFTSFKFTTEGKDTLTEVLASKGSIDITQVYTFATKLTDSLVFTQLSSLNPKQIKPVGTVSAQSNTVETRLQIDNADLTADYNLQGIALVGTFNKTNFVLGYINTNEVTNVPAFSGNQVQTIALDVSFAISDTSIITINTQTAGMLTVADYNALVAFIKDQVAPLALDKKVVHLTNNEIIDGIKTFKQKITGSISGNANTVDYINIHQITANIDLNTLTTNGNYLSTLETKTTSNKPGGTSEQYTLISTGNIQVFNDIKTDKTYIRNYIKSDTFTSWKVVIEDIDQTLNAQFNFTKVPTVNSKPVAIQADLQNETTNRTNADKTISNSLATEVSDRKSGDTTNANAIQAETTARSQADSSAAAALNTEKAARSSADASITKSLASEASARSAANVSLTNQFNTVNSGLNSESVARSSADAALTKVVSDTQKQVQTETTNRTNADNKIDSAAVHKTGNESIAGGKTFTDKSTFNVPIAGSFEYRPSLPVTKFADVATSMYKYNGNYSMSLSTITDAPGGLNEWSEVIVISSNGSLQGGQIIVIPHVSTNAIFIGHVQNGNITWQKIIDDSSLIHSSGNETIGGTKSFSSAIKGNLSGNASTADKLHTARTIGGINFDGGSNINLPGVNTQGNQNTTGNAASATKLQVARKVNGTAFDGTKDISVNAANDSNLVHQSGNESISGYKTFNNRLVVNGVSQANYFYKEVTTKDEVPILEFEDSSDGSTFIRRMGSYFSKDTYGGGIAISAAGLTVIGGGESPFNVINKIKDGTIDSTAISTTDVGYEDMIVSSDNSIYFLPGYQNQDTYNGMWRITTNGYLQTYNGTSWVNVLPNNSGLVAQDSAVVHDSGNETIAGTKSFSSTISGSVSGNAGSATKLQTIRKIGGVNFDGTANINLPGVNTQGNQNTTGNAATATKLQTARKVNGTPFDGTKDISINAANDSNIVHQSGNESIAGTKTFTDHSTFNSPIAGGFEYKPTLSVTKFADVANNMFKYNGNYSMNLSTITDAPGGLNEWSEVIVISSNNSTQGGQIIVIPHVSTNAMFIGHVQSGNITWQKIINDGELVHSSGNESIAGNKTFTGTVTAGGTQLTDSGWKSLTPSVGGTVKYRKVNGVVYVEAGSIPSLNNEGKTLVTLPAGYRPNDTIWSPWFAGGNMGNMTIDSDGSLTKASTNNPGKDQVQISLFVSYPADN